MRCCIRRTGTYTCGGGQVDNLSVMALDHLRDHSLNAVDHPLDIDIDRLINNRFREVLDNPRAEDACIVDQYVNPAELRKSLLDHREHFVSIGNISLDGYRLPPARRISSTTASAASRRSAKFTITAAPSRAKTCAVALPMPRDAPVTRATFPSSRPLTLIHLLP